MSNILNHNRLPFTTTLSLKEYWDFSLYLKECGGVFYGKLQDKCLAAYIDTDLDECVGNNCLVSFPNYAYSECKSKGLELKNIGFTGTDNGLLSFDKYTITVDEFEKMLTESVYRVEEGDCRLKVTEVGGNNQIYNYSNQMVTVDGVRCAMLNGGFFQGIYMNGDGCSYKILPNKLHGNGWSLEFELKRHDFENNHRTLNDVYPDNKGIFFYMGTRAENKWIKYYQSECEFEKSNIEEPYHAVDYISQTVCDEEFDYCLYSDYYPNTYIANTDCNCQDFLKEQEYLAQSENEKNDVDITETNDGHLLNEANLTEIESDNKYLLFDRSCKGVTTLTYEEGDKAVIQYRTIPDEENYFILFNRSCKGMTVLDYPDYVNDKGNLYNVYKDLYKNAFALQVRDDGSVGYKYFVKDCEAENPDCAYKIESEFTNPDEVLYDEWTKIHVRILCLSNPKLMRIMIYINGKLKLVSKELPVFDFRMLNDMPDKQEGVPFNISIGGGTQGLCDVIYNDFRKIPEYVYPLEKEFGGTFVGYFKTFKFYECSLPFSHF